MTDRLLSESAVIAAVQGERLCDNTGCPTDMAYEQALSDAIAAINTLPDAKDWQPIESALDVGVDRHVLIAGDDWVTIGRMIDRQWWEINNHPTDYWGDQLFPTHWQPLPAPPEQDT